MSSRRAERSTIGWRLGLLLTVSLGGAVGHPFHVEKLVVLHRHGSRTHLSKEHATLAEGGATLTPLGQRQLYQVGSELRARYFQPQCEPMRCLQQLDSGSYADDEVLVRSTGLARTLASAQSLLAGLYPPNATAAALDQGLPLGVQVVPVYSEAPSQDILLRAYDKCPTLRDSLAAHHASASFAAQETASLPLRETVAAAMGSEVPPLRDFYNTFDVLHLRQLGEPLDTDVPLLDAPTWLQVEQLASRVELERFSPAVVRNLCGGTLLSHLVTHLHLTEAQPGPALLQYSAHYPTLLCLLSALRSNPSGAAPAPDPHVEALPPYGSALLFEVHRELSTGARWVQLLYQAGPGVAPMVLPLPGGNTSGTPLHLPGALTSDEFMQWAAPRMFQDSQWCGACGAAGTLMACPAASGITVVPVAAPSDDRSSLHTTDTPITVPYVDGARSDATFATGALAGSAVTLVVAGVAGALLAVRIVRGGPVSWMLPSHRGLNGLASTDSLQPPSPNLPLDQL